MRHTRVEHYLMHNPLQGSTEPLKNLAATSTTHWKAFIIIVQPIPRETEEMKIIPMHRYLPKGVFNVTFGHEGICTANFYQFNKIVQIFVLNCGVSMLYRVINRCAER
jgi:hypothetical protein